MSLWRDSRVSGTECDFKCPPVLFLVFNRPDLARQVFRRIRDVRPSKLFVAADGPRENYPKDAELCLEVRRIVECVDWPCEVYRLYSEDNLGCREGPIAGINWIFKHVEQAIILEDDCLPHPSFFRFAGEMLEKFRDDTRVMHISGDNFAPSASPSGSSYYFSRYPLVWGWATWRRAWNLYDPDMTDWPVLHDTDWIRNTFNDVKQAQYWKTSLNFTLEHELSHSWDYQWMFTCWRHNSFNVTPGVNLVSNIGFGPNATHTVDPGASWANIKGRRMVFPLRHPGDMTICESADRSTFNCRFLHAMSLYRRTLRRISERHFWGSLLRRMPLGGKLLALWKHIRQ